MRRPSVRAAWGMGMMMRVLLVLAAAAQSARALTYRATVRSFLPAFCMRDASEYYAALGYAQRNVTQNYRLLEEAGPETCPYWEEGIAAGVVGGHPDFEAEGARRGAGLGIKFGVAQGIVSNRTAVGKSGVPKAVYCSSSRRCGEVLDEESGVRVPATAGAEYFEAWFHDDPFYNKRVPFAFDLVTTRCQAGTCEYIFDSDLHNEFDPSAPSDGFFGPLDRIAVGLNSSVVAMRDAPAWPQTPHERDDAPAVKVSSDHKFWYTTEIHSYFEYRGDETFNFTGDDDVWVFVNGHLVVDIGGVHAEATGQVALALHEERIGLTPGEIYTLDLFHAERHTWASNFKLTTTISEACNVLESGSKAVSLPGSDAARLALRGAQVDAAAGVLAVAHPGMPHDSSFAFVADEQNVGTGFVADFDFVVGTQGAAQGFAFVLHQRPQGLDNMPISTGTSLGLAHLSHSLAVVFDLSLSPPQVRVHMAGEPAEANRPSAETLRAVEDMRSFRLGRKVSVSVQYLERPDFLEVYLDGSLYVRFSGLDLQAALGGGRNAFVGFTSGTGGAPAWVNVTRFSLSTVSLDPAKSGLVASAPAAAAKELVADGSSAVGFTVETRDKCANRIHYGGHAGLLRGLFVEQLDAEGAYGGNRTRPLVLPAGIVDNEDGTYTAQLSTVELGSFRAFLCTGSDCLLQVQLAAKDGGSGEGGSDGDGDGNAAGRRRRRRLQDQEVLVATVSLASNSSADSQLLVPDGSVQSVPPKPKPTLAPTSWSAAPTAEPDTTLEMLAIGGGGGLLFLLLLVCLLVFLARRWGRNKRYIDKGREARLGDGVDMEEGDYNHVGLQLFNVRRSIMRNRARADAPMRNEEIGDLEQERADLQEHIRLQKKRLQQETANKEAALTPFQPAVGPAKTRRQFRPAQMSMRGSGGARSSAASSSASASRTSRQQASTALAPSMAPSMAGASSFFYGRSGADRQAGDAEEVASDNGSEDSDMDFSEAPSSRSKRFRF